MLSVPIVDVVELFTHCIEQVVMNINRLWSDKKIFATPYI